MHRNMPQSGRNCSFFPIARGRFGSILRMRTDNRGVTFYMPSSFHVGNVFWRLFFTYAFLGMIVFVVFIVGINNAGWDILPFIEHPQRNSYLIAIGVILILPILFFMTRAVRKPFPCMRIDAGDETITAGTCRRNSWITVDHQYRFTDLGAIEVLRNYELMGEGYIGRPGGNDSYELNLFFLTDNTWLGISESTRRQKVLAQADLLHRITGVAYKETNVSDMTDALPSEEGYGKAQTESSSLEDLPPFIREMIGEPVHEVGVNPAKLKRKGNPFSMKVTDQMGQKFLDLVMPVVAHFVNKVEYSKSLGALEFLCSDRDDDRVTRDKKVADLINSGWSGEEELYETLCNIFDAQTGPIPGLSANRDSFERDYMTLKDRIKVPSVKYRIILFEYLDKVIDRSYERIDRYEKNPGSLAQVQNSESYAFRFIVDLAAVIIIAMFAIFSMGSLIFTFSFDFSSPGALLGSIIPMAITIGLIYIWRRVRKKLGRSIKSQK